MKSRSLFGVVAGVAILAVSAFALAGEHQHMKTKVALGGVTGDQALNGIPMLMSPEQLPAQFRTQIRSDASESKGVAILKREGADIHYTFAWFNLTSPVISAHFHKAPEGSVGARAYSICGVAGESPACPTGTTNSISGVWKQADTTAVQEGTITIAFHTEVYPAPIGELAVYIPASSSYKAASVKH
jgi:hypothetical protein